MQEGRGLAFLGGVLCSVCAQVGNVQAETQPMHLSCGVWISRAVSGPTKIRVLSGVFRASVKPSATQVSARSLSAAVKKTGRPRGPTGNSQACSPTGLLV